MSPNFLIITSDQHRADCIGIEGRRIKTPHLDQLARQGTRFSAAITPCVVCQPARASILTGQLPCTHGVHDNGIDLRPGIGENGFAGALGKSGYHTSFFGKAHFSTFHTFEPTGTPECLRSSSRYADDWFGPYMGFEHIEMMLVGHNWFLPKKPPHGQHYERWFHADGNGDEKNRLYQESARDTHGSAQTWHSRLPVSWHNSTWTADRAIYWLREHARKDRPFCTWISFPDPHHPFDAPEPWSYLHSPEEVDLPTHRSRNFKGRPWWHEAVLTAEPRGKKEHAETRKNYSRIEEQTDRQLREITANYYGQISLIDHQVGRIMNCLDDSGLADNTVVIFSSDHGDWLGDHGLILKGPMHYEGLLRVPLLVRGPGINADTVNPNPVSTLDLCSTLCDYAGASPLLPQHGTSLRPLLENVSESREFARNEWDLLPTRTGIPLMLQTVRTRTAKLTIDEISGAGEMYLLDQDPDELINQFDNPKYASLRGMLEGHIRSRPDDRLPQQEQVGMA